MNQENDTTAQDEATVAAGLWFDSSYEGGPTEAEYEAALAALDRLTARIATLEGLVTFADDLRANEQREAAAALARAEQAERERDEWERLWKQASMGVRPMTEQDDLRLISDLRKALATAERERDALRAKLTDPDCAGQGCQARWLDARAEQAALREATDLLLNAKARDGDRWTKADWTRRRKELLAALSTEGEPRDDISGYMD